MESTTTTQTSTIPTIEITPPVITGSADISVKSSSSTCDAPVVDISALAARVNKLEFLLTNMEIKNNDMQKSFLNETQKISTGIKDLAEGTSGAIRQVTALIKDMAELAKKTETKELPKESPGESPGESPKESPVENQVHSNIGGPIEDTDAKQCCKCCKFESRYCSKQDSKAPEKSTCKCSDGSASQPGVDSPAHNRVPTPATPAPSSEFYQIQTPVLNVRAHYEGSIPPVQLEVYDMFGVKYVSVNVYPNRTSKSPTEWFVYADKLKEIVNSKNLTF